ncbi:MAG TPA: phosphocholine cytidylyltransferase family protein [Longimicrobiales bacterium]|nr:phosphocholine cytidylyltransferase family protein [Longimicrobiales bacterium]
MKAIILAAGMGSRLGPKAKGRPKALQKVGGGTLIEHQLEALSAEGIGPVVVVVGHGADQIRSVLGDSVEYVVNERPDATNSLYSLWLAADHLSEEGVMLLNCDVLFHPEVLKRLQRVNGSALAYDSTSHGGSEQTKVGLRGSRIVDLGKDFPETGARGENLGIIRLDGEGAIALKRRAEAIITAGGEKTWVTEAIRSILAEVEITGVNMAGLPWVEIDFPYDLDRARRQVWPAIQRSLHPGRQMLRRLRVPLALAAALLVIVAASWLSGQVGPASIDWESLTLEGAQRVSLEREDKGAQKWWLLPKADSLQVAIDGPALIRLETRPLLQQGTVDTIGYVVELSLDGEPYRYASHRAAVDRAATLAGYTVGRRDREKYPLPPGRHVLAVRFLAGQPRALLVRVRVAE